MSLINKSLLFEHFAGRTSPLQKRLIEQWLESEPNKELFYCWLVEWENTYPVYAPEMEQPLENFSHYIRNPRIPSEAPVSVTNPGRRKLSFRWFIAAAVLIGMVSTGVWLVRDHILYKIYESSFGVTRVVDLPDGSKVTLNANSCLKVPRFSFGKKNREVFLEGEAYFVVQHTADHMKFLVRTPKNMDVVVLGTEFNVYARPNATRVILNKGKVKINYRAENTLKQIMLKPGDLMVYNTKSPPSIESHVETAKHIAWKEHRFIFEDMPLREFGELLTRNYGLNVEIQNEELAKRTLAGSFKADSADELLQCVSEIFDLKMVRKGKNKILLLENN